MSEKDEIDNDTQADSPVRAQPGHVDVPLVEEDDDKPEQEESPGTRGERKAARGRMRQENEDLRRRLEENDRALQELRANQARTDGYVQGISRGTHQQEPQDPLRDQLDQLDQQDDLLVREYELKKDKLTQEELTKMRERARRIQRDKGVVTAQIAMRQAAPTQQQHQQQESWNNLRAKYPDVTSNRQAMEYAVARYHTMRLEPGGANLTEGQLTDRAMREAEVKILGRGARPSPSPAMRQKLEGQPRGPSGAPETATAVRLSPVDIQNADRLYANIKDPAARYRHYAKQAMPKQKST